MIGNIFFISAKIGCFDNTADNRKSIPVKIILMKHFRCMVIALLRSSDRPVVNCKRNASNYNIH